jgi:hypothetical protein
MRVTVMSGMRGMAAGALALVASDAMKTWDRPTVAAEFESMNEEHDDA